MINSINKEILLFKYNKLYNNNDFLLNNFSYPNCNFLFYDFIHIVEEGFINSEYLQFYDYLNQYLFKYDTLVTLNMVMSIKGENYPTNTIFPAEIFKTNESHIVSPYLSSLITTNYSIVSFSLQTVISEGCSIGLTIEKYDKFYLDTLNNNFFYISCFGKIFTKNSAKSFLIKP